MLNSIQYDRLKPYLPVIKIVGAGKGNTSNKNITLLCNEIWGEMGKQPKNLSCSYCVFELFKEISDYIRIYEETNGTANGV